MVQAFIPSGSLQDLATLGANSFTGDQDLGDNDLLNVRTATFFEQTEILAQSGTINLNWSARNHYKQAEPNGAITYTFTNPAGPAKLQLLVYSDGISAAQTFTWPANVKWLGSVWAPVANKKAIISLWYDGDKYYAMGVNEA